MRANLPHYGSPLPAMFNRDFEWTRSRTGKFSDNRQSSVPDRLQIGNENGPCGRLWRSTWPRSRLPGPVL